MKYWWLEKYKNLKVKMLPELFLDLQFFLVMPKNASLRYQEIKDLPLSSLEEEDLCLLLYQIVSTKNLKDDKLSKIIDRLLTVPETILPISDYSLQEMLEEVKNLYLNRPLEEKLKTNNVAACYHCMNIFYVDRIHNVNKNHLCVCPYCGRTKLYFDNDYVPMNYSFLFLAKLYYGVSRLGCDFLGLQAIAKKDIHVVARTRKTPSFSNDLSFCLSFQEKAIRSEDELPLIKSFYDCFRFYEERGEYRATIVLPWKGTKNLFELSFLLLLASFAFLSNSFYLKEIEIVVENPSLRKEIRTCLRQVASFT